MSCIGRLLLSQFLTFIRIDNDGWKVRTIILTSAAYLPQSLYAVCTLYFHLSVSADKRNFPQQDVADDFPIHQTYPYDSPTAISADVLCGPDHVGFGCTDVVDIVRPGHGWCIHEPGGAAVCCPVKIRVQFHSAPGNFRVDNADAHRPTIKKVDTGKRFPFRSPSSYSNYRSMHSSSLLTLKKRSYQRNNT